MRRFGSLGTKLVMLAIVTTSAAHVSVLNAAGSISRVRPYGRPILAAFIAAVLGWLARDYWLLYREWSDPETAIIYRIKAIGLTFGAVLSSIIAVCSLLYDLFRY